MVFIKAHVKSIAVNKATMGMPKVLTVDIRADRIAVGMATINGGRVRVQVEVTLGTVNEQSRIRPITNKITTGTEYSATARIADQLVNEIINNAVAQSHHPPEVLKVTLARTLSAMVV